MNAMLIQAIRTVAQTDCQPLLPLEKYTLWWHENFKKSTTYQCI